MGCRVGVVGAGACGGRWLSVSVGGHGLGLCFLGLCIEHVSTLKV